MMSNQNRYSPTPQAVDERLGNFDMALRIATIMAEANERLFKLQSEAVAAAFEEHTKQLKALQTNKGSGPLLAEWAGRYQANVRRILEVTRASFEIVPHTQAEMANLVGEPFTPYNKQMQEYIDHFAAAITDGRDAAAVAVENVLAKALASVSGNKPANKEAVA